MLTSLPEHARFRNLAHSVLHGREAEMASVEALLAEARDGPGGALILLGDAGVGKTALLDAVSRDATNMRHLKKAGLEAESSLPFSALAELTERMLDGLSALPEPQAAAIQGALALGPPAPGDRFAACAGFLGLLSNAAAEQPLLVVVDDAHWLDPASAECVGFAARRLEGLPIALLVAARADESTRSLDPASTSFRDRPRPGSRSGPLKDVDPALPSDVAESLVDAAAGNPLALIELPPQLTPDQRRGSRRSTSRSSRGPPAAGVLHRVARLPRDPRALLVAATSFTPSIDPILAACGTLEIEAQAFEPAEAQDIVRLSSERIEFGHPLLRGAVYREPAARAQARAPGARRAHRRGRAGHGISPPPHSTRTRRWPTRSRSRGPRAAARGAHGVGRCAGARRAPQRGPRGALRGACSPRASRPRWAAPTIAASRCWSRPPRSTIPSCAPRYATARAGDVERGVRSAVDNHAMLTEEAERTGRRPR